MDTVIDEESFFLFHARAAAERRAFFEQQHALPALRQHGPRRQASHSPPMTITSYFISAKTHLDYGMFQDDL